MIIGAGIHGISTALALASRGRRSVILEAGPAPFTGASVRNEGKLHLGFVYALDRSGSTNRAMVEGALAFAPLVERWCGEIEWAGFRSDRFRYVAMEEGLVGPDRVEAHYETVLDRLERSAPSYGRNYIGVDPTGAEIIRREGVLPGMAEGHSACWFETPERAVDPRALAGCFTAAADRESLIAIRTGSRVSHARRLESGFSLQVETASGTRELEAETVVNCAWEGRPHLDAMILEDDWKGVFRIKHQVLLKGGDPAGIPTATLVQGPFGDVVVWPNGDVYISWYPEARTHFGERHDQSLRSDDRVARKVHEVMVRLFPALEGFSLASHAPCYILAEGRTDIDDRESELHRRLGAEFVEHGGWWSIRSSKLTTAPLAGERCAARITGTQSEF